MDGREMMDGLGVLAVNGPSRRGERSSRHGNR